MARTQQTPQTMSPAGLRPTLTAPNVDGIKIPNDGATYYECVLSTGGPVNVTVQTGGTLGGKAVADDVISLASGLVPLKIGPWRPEIYNQPVGAADEGMVYIDFASVTNISGAAVKMF